MAIRYLEEETEKKPSRIRYVEEEEREKAITGSSGDIPEKKETLFGLPEKAEKAIFPTTSEMKGVKAAGLQALEALGTPVRLAGKLRTNPETGEKYKASDPQSAFFRPEMEKIKSKLPEPSPTGGPLQTPNLLRGGVEIAGGLASDPTVMAGVARQVGKTATGKIIKKGITKAVEFPNKALGKFAEELSGVSEEALRKTAPFTGGGKALKAAAGTQRKIGEKLLKNLENFDDYLPEKAIVDNALDNMPPINIKHTTRTLEDFIDPQAIGKGKTANVQIEAMIKDLEGVGKKLSAKKFRALRTKIDKEIGDAFGKEAGEYITALKAARTQMKNKLIAAAEKTGNPEYAKAMQSFHKKLELVEELKGYIGKSDKMRNKKIEGFIGTLFGKNKADRQRVLSELSEVFGEDFVEEAKLAQLASQLGEEGAPTLLPRQTTGRSLLSVGPQIVAGSPRIASKLTLPAAQAAEELAKKLGVSVQKATEILSRGRGIPGAAYGISSELGKKRFGGRR